MEEAWESLPKRQVTVLAIAQISRIRRRAVRLLSVSDASRWLCRITEKHGGIRRTALPIAARRLRSQQHHAGGLNSRGGVLVLLGRNAFDHGALLAKIYRDLDIFRGPALVNVQFFFQDK